MRTFQDGRDGRYYVEWREPVIDAVTGKPVMEADRRGARPKFRKPRMLLQGVADPDVARARADQIALNFLRLEDTQPGPTRPLAAAEAVANSEGISVAALIDRYLDEATPTKGESKQDHDRRAARLFKEQFKGVRAAQLDRTHWDAFIAARRNGEIRGFGPVNARQLVYDAKFMIAVLGWGLGASDEYGRPYLDQHPWSAERRKACGMRMPKGGPPRRPVMTEEIRDGLIRHSPNQMFTAALLLGRHTVSRNSSVRHLRWSDVDLANGTVRWRGEVDKNGHEVTVPLPLPAIEALRDLQRGIGSAWVFPAERDAESPTSRHTFQTWLRRAKARFLRSIEDPDRKRQIKERMRGLGFHGEKRAGVQDSRFRRLEPKIQEAIARTNHETLRKIYDDVGVDEIAAAMQRQGLLGIPEEQLAAVRWQQPKM